MVKQTFWTDFSHSKKGKYHENSPHFSSNIDIRAHYEKWRIWHKIIKQTWDLLFLSPFLKRIETYQDYFLNLFWANPAQQESSYQDVTFDTSLFSLQGIAVQTLFSLLICYKLSWLLLLMESLLDKLYNGISFLMIIISHFHKKWTIINTDHHQLLSLNWGQWTLSSWFFLGTSLPTFLEETVDSSTLETLYLPAHVVLLVWKMEQIGMYVIEPTLCM